MTRVELREEAPGKVNLCLYVGELRDDGRHSVVSLIETVDLCDTLILAAARAGTVEDQVCCPGVEGPNLSARALAAFRAAAGWDAPAQRLTIEKRIPVAAGMGGGSSDAAATLRLAARAAGDAGPELLERLAPGLGSDVPALLGRGACLVGGAGEEVERVADLAAHGLVVIPSSQRLSAAEVYAEADRLGGLRPAAQLADLRAAIAAALSPGAEVPLELVHNDLEPAVRSLAPTVEHALSALHEAGAGRALISGSGPTAFGLFSTAQAARDAAAALSERFPETLALEPVPAAEAT